MKSNIKSVLFDINGLLSLHTYSIGVLHLNY